MASYWIHMQYVPDKELWQTELNFCNRKRVTT